MRVAEVLENTNIPNYSKALMSTRPHKNCTNLSRAMANMAGQWLREETITEQLGAMFKNLQMPKEIIQQITDTLNEVHQGKIDLNDGQFVHGQTQGENYRERI